MQCNHESQSRIVESAMAFNFRILTILIQSGSAWEKNEGKGAEKRGTRHGFDGPEMDRIPLRFKLLIRYS